MLSEYDFKIKHLPGKLNVVADGLSRLPRESINQEDVASKMNELNEELIFAITGSQTLGDNDLTDRSQTEMEVEKENFKLKQKLIRKLLEKKTEQDKIDKDLEREKLGKLGTRQEYEIINLTDKIEIKKNLTFYHNTLLGGHEGIGKMKQRMKKRYHWKGMDNEIREYVLNCEK